MNQMPEITETETGQKDAEVLRKAEAIQKEEYEWRSLKNKMFSLGIRLAGYLTAIGIVCLFFWKYRFWLLPIVSAVAAIPLYKEDIITDCESAWSILLQHLNFFPEPDDDNTSLVLFQILSKGCVLFIGLILLSLLGGLLFCYRYVSYDYLFDSFYFY